MAETKPERFFHIDFLRAVAILGVMVIHSLALFLGPTAINLIWNYLHFVVVGFVLASGYVTVAAFERAAAETQLFAWYEKRFIRLYLPFAVYVIYLLIFGRVSSLRFLFASLTFYGGADVGWLTLLFLQLAILTPLYLRVMKNDKFTKIFMVFLLIFSLFMFFYRIPSSYSRLIAWLPWSLIFLFGSLLAKYEKLRSVPTKYFLLIGLGSLIFWLIFRQTLIYLHEPLTLTLHKYPPDLYYFLYGIAVNSALLAVVSSWHHRTLSIIRVVSFISKHSYGMFFLNSVVLDLLAKFGKLSSPILFTGVSLGLTLGIMWVFTLIF